MPSKSGNLKAILASPSYKLAEQDVDFLARPELRPVRLQLELLKPEMALRDDNIRSTVVVFGGTQVVELPEARLAFTETMNGFGPAPYVRLMQDLRKEWKEPTLEGVLALLRLGNWDHEVLLGFRETLKKQLPNANDAMKLEVVTALKQEWERYYPLQHDLAFDLAGFCLMMKEAREALFYCRESLRLYGDHYLTHFRAGLALGVMGEMQQALEAMDKALELKPDHVAAREMRIRYEARLRA